MMITHALLRLTITACLCITASVQTLAASYEKTDGTIVDPILNLQEACCYWPWIPTPHSYSGNNLAPSADLTNANLSNAYLPYTNLTQANLTNANLTQADLSDADLSDAWLRDVDLTDANLTGANLSFANLSDANLINLKHWEYATFTGAFELHLLAVTINANDAARSNDFKIFMDIRGP